MRPLRALQPETECAHFVPLAQPVLEVLASHPVLLAHRFRWGTRARVLAAHLLVLPQLISSSPVLPPKTESAVLIVLLAMLALEGAP